MNRNTANYSNCIDNHHVIDVSTPLVNFLTSIPSNIVNTMVTWQKRAQDRAQLRTTSDYLLKDMGIRRVDAEREMNKPFWQA